MAAVLAVLAAGGTAQAQDLELGRYLSNECMTCHANPAPGAAIPDIFGKPAKDIADALKAYRSKERTNDVMQNIASRLKDDEIDALAAFYATAKRP